MYQIHIRGNVDITLEKRETNDETEDTHELEFTPDPPGTRGSTPPEAIAGTSKQNTLDPPGTGGESSNGQEQEASAVPKVCNLIWTVALFGSLSFACAFIMYMCHATAMLRNEILSRKHNLTNDS
ncbi:Hypothetical predicted protein [Cloeon dipterum]|uniref:Uncharacterized protein n=1 Tax=Cloeon dipterum TaxID=197152 RepID=A0A8S1DRB8_9INSE|nr:Hypothetical predicted protein [Cloeon dipterum]